MIKVGDLEVTTEPEANCLLIQFSKWDNDGDGLWCTRCRVFWEMTLHGAVVRSRPHPTRLPDEMLDQMHEHQDKLKAIFLLGRK